MKTATRKPSAAKRTETVEVEGRELVFSNLDKVYYPSTGFTKGEVIHYYARIAPTLLPYLKGRAVTLKRYPDGVEGFFFYEKNCPAHRPPWMSTRPVRTTGSRTKKGEGVSNYCKLDTLPALLWVANTGAIELHPMLAPAVEDPAKAIPDWMVFDLDPGPPAALVDCCEIAMKLRAALEDLGLVSYPKTSGGKGLQLYVPLNTPVSFAETKDAARTLAMHMESEMPERVVSVQKKTMRTGKILIDWSQNDTHKSTVCVYSLRARAEPTVSTPVTWAEVASAVKKKNASSLIFGPEDVLKRVEKHGDLFEPVRTTKQRLANV